MTSSPVRAVIFDWGGTLTPWHDVDLTAQWQRYAAAYWPQSADGPDPRAAQLATRILALEELAWQRGRCEGHSSARLHEILVEAGVDLDGDSAAAALTAYRSFWEPHTLTDPLVRPTWEALRRKGIRVGVLSNTIWDRAYHRAIFARDGVDHLIDADVYSSELDWIKPHPQAFLTAAAAVGAEPGECVYVGDRSFEDVHGPQAVGMRAIWVPHSTIPAAQQVSHQATPDAVAHRLTDVVTIVQEWS